MQDLIVTPIQADLVWEDTTANLTAFDRQLADVALPTDLVVLPEMFNTGFSINPGLAEEPEGRDGAGSRSTDFGRAADEHFF